jgi:hypothetical protein
MFLSMSTRPLVWGRWIVPILACCLSPLSTAQVNVTTYHYDNARTGQNTAEKVLTLSNVNSSQFGKLFSVAVDGYVYAQPLYLANVTISGAVHNVLYVATEHDSVYAIDADNGAVLWQQSFINQAAGITTVSSSDVACSDLVPEIGVTSTPVIDRVGGTLYVVAKTKENGSYVQRLHALDLATHAEKFGGPKVISATLGGRTFDPLKQANRPGLLLENGHVIVAWASHCDNGPYQGWVISYNATTLGQDGVFNTELNLNNGTEGGIWMSGDGIAADANGNLYFATGNGEYNGTNNFGDTILKLTGPASGTFSAVDWFTPFNQSTLEGGDTDLGAGGVLLLPDLPAGSAHQQLLVQEGKQGKIYLVDRNNMGKFCSTCTSIDTNIVQEIPGASTGIWGSPAFWNNTVYWGGGNDGGTADYVKAWSFNANGSGLLSTSPVSQTSQVFSFSTAAPVISANGTSNGILWILDNSSYLSTCCQVLYAFNASNLGTMLYNSNQAAGSRDVPGGAVKFTAPVVANGKIYVGSQGKVSAFGILGNPVAAAPTFSPAQGTYANSVTVTLSDATSGATIHCTTDGSTPTTASPFCTSVTINSTTQLQAIAVASGFTNSPVTSGTYSIVSGSSINYGSGFTSTGLALNGSAAISSSRLRLTNGGARQAASAFYNALIGIQNFTNDFSFQLTNPSADGMTFTIQGTGTTAIGPYGGGLGYGPSSTTGTPGIGKSVAIKFDLYSNNGEGNNSTGMYTNGASPTTPAITLAGGVNLHSGDVFNVHMTYDGTTLKMTITDASVPTDTFTASWTVNIPTIVGSTTAYVGFTAGTGDLSAIQDIVSWTYSSTTSLPTAATPTFSPAPGAYSSAQSVTLSDTTAGAAIHYTTDGTTPSPSSATYSTAISVSTSETIKAIAVASGYNNSAVATATYSITTGGMINFGSGFSSAGMALNGSTSLNGTRLRLTNGGGNQAGSGFYTTPINVQSFATDFSFQLTNPNADGIAFVLQNTGTTALGASGGALGYAGIGHSVAVKFDLYSNSGEGSNSTGIYVNGASPTIPAVMLGGGVNLHSGDVFKVHITYDGTALTMTITDASVPADTFTTSWPINIPSTVGANTVLAGFTGGTGGLTATQEIISWTYAPSGGQPILYNAETVPSSGQPDARVFSWPGFNDGSGVALDATQAGNYITFLLDIPQPGNYDVKYASKLFDTRGIGQLSVAGTNVGLAVDQYAPTSNGTLKEFDVGTVSIPSAGSYQFTFTVTGKNASSSGYSLTFDYITLTQQ